jgi:uncharacterized protein
MIAPSHMFNRVRATLGAPAALYAVADGFAGRGAHARAFPLFVEAAQSGLRQAQYRLGRCYKFGLGVPPSLGEALRWFLRAAEAGDAMAQTQLAELALQGISDQPPSGLFEDCCQTSGTCVTSGFERAEHWCRKAVAGGSEEAKALLAFILTNGPLERRDAAASKVLYREAADAGWSRGQLGLALSRLHDATPESIFEAHALLAAAAANGVAAAHHLLGVLLESGAAGDVDLPAAASHYKAAAELGHIASQVRYGFALLHGRGVAEDAFTAETWLRRAGLAGDAQAAAVVGYLYVRDGELPPNYAEASMWLRRAAEAGHAAAARTLGRILLMGVGIPRDVAEAARWLREAAAGGDETARGDLLRLVLAGQLAAVDQQAVIDMLRAAAEAGDPKAEYDLGLFLAHGIGVSQDDQAALALICRSAKRGHPDATRMLAQLAAAA